MEENSKNKWLRWIGGGPGGPKRIQTFRWLLLLGLTGVALIILNSFITVKDIDPAGSGRASPGEQTSAVFGSASREQTSFREYEEAYQNKLREMLTQIVGVGEVEVLVTIESTEEIQTERNTKESQQVTSEKDQHGATRHITDITRSGDVVVYETGGNGKQPLIVKTIKPKIRGVLVVAKGAENLTVKKMMIEAVERGLDVPAHRISILPRKQ
ncbi:stage III sporulation protein AG [Paenibacillus sp. UNCCL117]|uniref:stage III sporulation protein AG n=1 Tax=unclassified Paenibacillus TaxID=185978 RepID=UPI000891D523|nr:MULTISPECIES: stage III sporulation protein AG [unclassified Paenibacillus]SDD44065.1 stage III sporulation protein AG [Paenibacillus sp. cl123]SFW47219.1 stage III sporulation protein AG [Paenibacillus sp. UNCCL117]